MTTDYTIKTRVWIVLGLGFIWLILMSLGFWQLDRAKQKRTILADYTRADTTVDWKRLKVDPTPYDYNQIEFKAHWQGDKSFLLDNQFYQHQLGYHVITPVTVGEDPTWLLVDRGFIPKSTSFTFGLPQSQVLRGRIFVPSKQTLLLGNIENNQSWPRILERIDFAHISTLLKHPVYPVVLWMDSESPNGFVRSFTPVIMPPERHIAYAVQWFLLAALLFLFGVYSMWGGWSEGGSKR